MKQKHVFTLTLPVLMGYVPLGAAFGILAASAGFNFIEMLLSSLIVYAGAGQFLLVALVSAGASFMEVVIASFFLNFRHFFYTLSLLEEFKKINFLKHYIMFALTDESFALISSHKKYITQFSLAQRSKILFFICLCNHIYWIIGSILGFLFQKNVNINYDGIEFSLTALFIVLGYELYKQNPNHKILLTASTIALIALLFIDKNYMFVFCLSVAIALLFIGRKYV